MRAALPSLSLPLLFVLACSSGSASEVFDAGPVDSFPPASVTTFADLAEVHRTTLEGSTGDQLLGGDLVFHLVRLESGDFLALNADDTHSGCRTIWDPDADAYGIQDSGTPPGWFRDPCHGAMYDERGMRVFGPAPRDLDRYPVEVRDGHVYVTLSADALIPGKLRVEFVDPNATPTPGRSPQPTATRSSFLETSTPTATPTPTSPSVGTPTPAMPGAAPDTGAPWSAADLLLALDANDIHVQPTGRTFACAQVNGLPGAEYGGDASFILWVYPSEQAAAEEWIVYSYEALHPVLECDRAPARIYRQGNMVLWTPAGEAFSTQSLRSAEIFLGLPGGPLPSEIHQFALVPPATGAPLGAGDLLDQLESAGLIYVPYEQPGCPSGASTVSLQWMAGPLTLESRDDVSFQLWVFPSIADLEAEWQLGVNGRMGATGVHSSRYADCDYEGGSIYRNANMLLTVNDSVVGQHPQVTTQIVDAFLALRP